MRTKVRVFATTALVLMMALGAWSAVLAERGASAGGASTLGNLFASWLQRGSPSSQAATSSQAVQASDDRLAPQLEHRGLPQAGEDNVEHRMDDSLAPARAPEPGDDRGGQNGPNASLEAQSELTGTVTAIDATSITIDGRAFQLAAGVEGVGAAQLGALVKVEFVTNADGSVSVREIKVGDVSAGSGEPREAGDDSSVQHESRNGANSGTDDGHQGGGSGNGGDDGSDG